MSGYLQFYSEHPTIEKIAERINSAGHAYHHTECWGNVEDYNDGKSWSDLIQKAMDEAAVELTACQEKLARYEQAARELPEVPQTTFHAPVNGQWHYWYRALDYDKLRAVAVALKVDLKVANQSRDEWVSLYTRTKRELAASQSANLDMLDRLTQATARSEKAESANAALKQKLATARMDERARCAVRGRLAQLEGKLVDAEISALTDEKEPS